MVLAVVPWLTHVGWRYEELDGAHQRTEVNGQLSTSLAQWTQSVYTVTEQTKTVSCFTRTARV